MIRTLSPIPLLYDGHYLDHCLHGQSATERSLCHEQETGIRRAPCFRLSCSNGFDKGASRTLCALLDTFASFPRTNRAGNSVKWCGKLHTRGRHFANGRPRICGQGIYRLVFQSSAQTAPDVDRSGGGLDIDESRAIGRCTLATSSPEVAREDQK
jgi:hypothetical protein